MKKTIRYLLMFNPVSMVIFCLLPTVESRRGLLLFKFKEVFSMRFSQIKESIRFLIFPSEPNRINRFPASYLGGKKVFIPMSDEEKLLLEKSERIMTVQCFSPTSNEELSFRCSICDDNSKGIKASFRCFASKKLALISNPTNQWYFSFY